MNEDFRNSLLYRWTKDFVGSAASFVFVVSAVVLGGLLYTFQIVESSFMLLIFGVLLPVLFTICIYNVVLNCVLPGIDEEILKPLRVVRWNRMMMSVDCAVIIGFALLIQADLLNYMLFRFLLTVVVPLLLVAMLRGLFISIQHDEGEREES